MTQINVLAALLSMACGVACYYIAKDKGLKNPVVWGVAGVVGSVLALLLISFLRNKVLGKKMGKAQYFDNEDPD